MQVIVDKEAIRFNYEKAKGFCKNAGVTCSIMIKDFYANLGIQNTVNSQFWSCSEVPDSYNYVIGANSIRKHSGGIVTTLKEAVELSKLSKEQKKHFRGFIPVDVMDGREGLSIFDALKLLQDSKEFEHEFFDLTSITITSGCMHGNAPFPLHLSEICRTLKAGGATYISVGGSFYLGFVISNQLPKEIDDVRIGEYAIYGTVPFYDIPEACKGRAAIKVRLKVARIYEERSQALLMGGQTKFDSNKAMVLHPNYSFKDCSTEYTILHYINTPMVGDSVEFIPDYHSLIKLLR